MAESNKSTKAILRCQLHKCNWSASSSISYPLTVKTKNTKICRLPEIRLFYKQVTVSAHCFHGVLFKKIVYFILYGRFLTGSPYYAHVCMGKNTIQVYWRHRRKISSILHLSTRKRWVVHCSGLQATLPLEMEPWKPSELGGGWALEPVWIRCQREKSYPLPRITNQTV